MVLYIDRKTVLLVDSNKNCLLLLRILLSCYVILNSIKHAPSYNKTHYNEMRSSANLNTARKTILKETTAKT